MGADGRDKRALRALNPRRERRRRGRERRPEPRRVRECRSVGQARLESVADDRKDARLNPLRGRRTADPWRVRHAPRNGPHGARRHVLVGDGAGDGQIFEVSADRVDGLRQRVGEFDHAVAGAERDEADDAHRNLRERVARNVRRHGIAREQVGRCAVVAPRQRQAPPVGRQGRDGVVAAPGEGVRLRPGRPRHRERARRADRERLRRADLKQVVLADAHFLHQSLTFRTAARLAAFTSAGPPSVSPRRSQTFAGAWTNRCRQR